MATKRARKVGRKLGDNRQAERVLFLYDHLRRGNTVRIGEMAKTLSASVRQIQRDMTYLRGRLALEQGMDGGWRAQERETKRERRTSRAQILAMELGVKLSAFLWNRSELSAIQGRIDTLAQELFSADRARLASWRRRVAVVAPGQKDYASSPESGKKLDAMLDAMVSASSVRLTYRSHKAAMAGKPARALVVHPLGLVFYRDGAYFIVDVTDGDADLRGRRILLALERIESLKVGDAGAFEIPRGFDARAFFGDAFGIWNDGVARDVVLEVHAEHARWFLERTMHPSQEVEQRTDGSLLVTLHVSGVVEIVDWVVSLGPHAEVIAPPDLRELVRRKLGEALAQYR